uniref:Uncharacterized protein n=1 Tax=Fundulus heteroclitus TaxID=8078 RepID=A0A3Q2NQG1_FUNHE
MSLKENACRKFQANIFNKSKCQNCFKPRESHLLNDEDLSQVRNTFIYIYIYINIKFLRQLNPIKHVSLWVQR